MKSKAANLAKSKGLVGFLEEEVSIMVVSSCDFLDKNKVLLLVKMRGYIYKNWIMNTVNYLMLLLDV